MNAPDRRGLLDRDHAALSIHKQCEPLGIARSDAYRTPQPANDNDLALLRRIDEPFTAWSSLGSRWMTALLRAEGHCIKLHTAVDYVLRSRPAFRLPEPIRLADHLSRVFR